MVSEKEKPSPESPNNRLDRLYQKMLDRMKKLLTALRFRGQKDIIQASQELRNALKSELKEAPESLKKSLNTSLATLEKTVQSDDQEPQKDSVKKGFAALTNTITTSQEDGSIPRAIGDNLVVVVQSISTLVADTAKFVIHPIKTWKVTVAELQKQEGDNIHII